MAAGVGVVVRRAPDEFTLYVLDQLHGLHDMQARAMFGGHGLYHQDRFFGLTYQGRIYFKTDDHTRVHYLARGMTTFQPNARQTLKNYYEVPAEIIEDAEQLLVWARAAAGI